MDQFVVAMLAALGFVVFAAGAIFLEVRRANRVDNDPSEHGGNPL